MTLHSSQKREEIPTKALVLRVVLCWRCAIAAWEDVRDNIESEIDVSREWAEANEIMKSPHAHIVNGTQVRARIINYPCDAVRYIYAPLDPAVRKVLLIHNTTGHNHPMPKLSKLSFGHKDTYLSLIDAYGVLGATVSKIDNAPSTKMRLEGLTPTDFAPPLHNKRAKNDMLRTVKLKKFPNGLDVGAIEPMFHAELTKPLPERYIHSYLKTSFDGDTTFKGIEGKMNEWEMTIFAKVVQRASSILRAYINRASTDFFETLCDELQHVKLMVTGTPIPLKKFVRGGNLLVTNVDMDPAQVIGLCRSVLKYNDPEYSGISNDTPPEEIAPLFIKICWRHAKEPVHDFESLVSPANFDRLKDFVYINSKETLDAFSAFAYGLKVKKITDWWRSADPLSQFNFDFNMFTDSILDSANIGVLSTDFDVAVPSGALSEEHFQGFLYSYGSGGLHATANFENVPSVGPFINPFPMLPPPPPESSPAPSPDVDHSSDPCPSAPKSRRSRKEADEANIVTSTRSRAPTERKRVADGDISSRPPKKGRARSITMCRVSSHVRYIRSGCVRHMCRGLRGMYRGCKCIFSTSFVNPVPRPIPLPGDPNDPLPMHMMQREPPPRALPAATAYGTVQSALALVCAQEYPWVYLAVARISEIAWGPHPDARQDYLLDLPCDQLVFVAAITEMISLEPDLAVFFDAAIADFANAWVDHCDDSFG
ncbi:hypothetical protein B0H13DRAFT_1900882 [Mycena leptocephala]|nr:hypothetical protein B0H13DRAFT_1900882 [Mycena leptocephala]